MCSFKKIYKYGGWCVEAELLFLIPEGTTYSVLMGYGLLYYPKVFAIYYTWKT